MSVAQLCPTLCDLVGCSPPGLSVHGILQARILEWVAIPFSRDLPNPGIKLRPLALQEDSLPSERPGKPKITCNRVFSALEGSREMLLILREEREPFPWKELCSMTKWWGNIESRLYFYNLHLYFIKQHLYFRKVTWWPLECRTKPGEIESRKSIREGITRALIVKAGKDESMINWALTVHPALF